MNSVIEGESEGDYFRFVYNGVKHAVHLDRFILEGARWQVVKAAEEGKGVEVWESETGKWRTKKHDRWRSTSFYRIAPEPPKPEYVPFTADDWEMFVGNPILWKNGDIYRLITEFCLGEVLFDGTWYSYQYALDNLTFMDGSPFGKKIS